MDIPSGMIRNRPKQRPSETIAAYHHRYKDYLYLRAFIENIGTNLGAKRELDNFLLGATHYDRLIVAVRNERLSIDPAVAIKYRNSNIVRTITFWLNHLHLEDGSPPSPSATDRRSNLRRLRSSERTSSLARSKSNINSLQISIADPLALLEIPRKLTNAQIYAVQRYKAAVSAVNVNPKKFTDDMNCAVCGQQHSFDECDWLKDIDFLRKFHIQFCLLMRRITNATAKVAVNSIDDIPADDATDFPSGEE